MSNGTPQAHTAVSVSLEELRTGQSGEGLLITPTI